MFSNAMGTVRPGTKIIESPGWGEFTIEYYLLLAFS